jgi:hypothetical protein
MPWLQSSPGISNSEGDDARVRDKNPGGRETQKRE